MVTLCGIVRYFVVTVCNIVRYSVVVMCSIVVLYGKCCGNMECVVFHVYMCMVMCGVPCLYVYGNVRCSMSICVW